MSAERTHRNVPDDSSRRARALGCGLLIRSRREKTPGGLKNSCLPDELGALESDTSRNSASQAAMVQTTVTYKNFSLEQAIMDMDSLGDKGFFQKG